MARFFAPITVEELEQRVNTAWEKSNFSFHGIKELNGFVKGDLGKVGFDTENVTIVKEDAYGPFKDMIGYNTLPNGMTYLGVFAGGDWEVPLFFLIYHDGKQLRGYIPEKGNLWNTDTNEAYGNSVDGDEYDDSKNAKKRWPDKWNKDDIIESDEIDCYDKEALIKDITDRIKPRPEKIKVIDKPKKIEKKSLQERIESLKYYMPGDESSELFSSTCYLCYKMVGLNQGDKAEILCQWAEEMAKESEEFAKQEGGEDDFMQGEWGGYEM